MNKRGLIALSFFLFGFVGVDAWATDCCGGIVNSYYNCYTPSKQDSEQKQCSTQPKKMSYNFYEGFVCCPPGSKHPGQCQSDKYACFDNTPPKLATLTNFAIAPIQSGFELKWETRSELDNAGFFIWRGIKAGDEYKNVHRVSELIPAEGNLIGGATYSYQDTISDFQNGLVYCYGLEDVNDKGFSTYHYDFIKCFPE